LAPVRDWRMESPQSRACSNHRTTGTFLVMSRSEWHYAMPTPSWSCLFPSVLDLCITRGEV
jgi:hypothetical protein